ncbi:hypothetical protein BD413DRAFT_574652 [Trametes elegans]|nr:hypothetical protein BD413DRAFT_574652 [Trametes elegans]
MLHLLSQATPVYVATRASEPSTSNMPTPATRNARSRAIPSTPVSALPSPTMTLRSASSPGTSSVRLRAMPTTAVAPPLRRTARTRCSSSTSAPRTPQKRKAEQPEASSSASSKRRRTTVVDDETRARAQRLKDVEKELRQREAAVKKREAAVVKKQNVLKREEARLSRKRLDNDARRQALQAKMRDVEAEEKECRNRERQLALQEKAVAKQKTGTAVESSDASKTAQSKWILSHLEDQFTCSLCYDVMACPYTLTPGTCGHSFCALCILKWCFTLVHRQCGYWHDSLECPLCRTELPYTPDRTPRSAFTFPFTPNRLADAAIKALLENLKSLQPSAGSAPRRTGSSSRTRSRGQVAGPSASAHTDGVSLWREGGASLTEWQDREKQGRIEMSRLANEWRTLQGDEFIAFMDRLGI